MPYTDFRKSYGDFEVVIPAVDFSSLTKYEATKIARSLRAYEEDFVCFYIKNATEHVIRDAFKQAIAKASQKIQRLGLDYHIYDGLGTDDVPDFHPCHPAGRILRVEWCRHMANEIEREFEL